MDHLHSANHTASHGRMWPLFLSRGFDFDEEVRSAQPVSALPRDSEKLCSFVSLLSVIWQMDQQLLCLNPRCIWIFFPLVCFAETDIHVYAKNKRFVPTHHSHLFSMCGVTST